MTDRDLAEKTCALLEWRCWAVSDAGVNYGKETLAEFASWADLSQAALAEMERRGWHLMGVHRPTLASCGVELARGYHDVIGEHSGPPSTSLYKALCTACVAAAAQEPT